MVNKVEVLSAWVLVRNGEGEIYLRPATGEDLTRLADRMMKDLGLSPFAFAPGKPGQG